LSHIVLKLSKLPENEYTVGGMGGRRGDDEFEPVSVLEVATVGVLGRLISLLIESSNSRAFFKKDPIRFEFILQNSKKETESLLGDVELVSEDRFGPF
jgi:hypothetical protein